MSSATGPYYIKVIHIRAEDSPNVRYAFAQREYGTEPDGELILPGVLPYDEFVHRRATFDKVMACISLDGRFWEGEEVMLYPPEWLNHSEHLADLLSGKTRQAEAIGVDPGEGVAMTAISIVDRYGLIRLISYPTPNTAVIRRRLVSLMEEYGVSAESTVLDRGGGGKQIADEMREIGYNVRTVAFGESPTPEPRRGHTASAERLKYREERYAYVNRRAEMYGILRDYINPNNGGGFAIPARYTDVRAQLAPIPLMYDTEGRLKLPPKNRRSPNSTELCLVDLIGRSPDEADSLVLAVYGMKNKPRRPKVTAA